MTTKKKVTKVKPMNENIPTYERTADIIVPKKVNHDIKPKEIFEGIDDKPKKKKTTKKNPTKKKKYYS